LDSIYLAQDRDQWRALETMATNLLCFIQGQKFIDYLCDYRKPTTCGFVVVYFTHMKMVQKSSGRCLKVRL